MLNKRENAKIIAKYAPGICIKSYAHFLSVSVPIRRNADFESYDISTSLDVPEIRCDFLIIFHFHLPEQIKNGRRSPSPDAFDSRGIFKVVVNLGAFWLKNIAGSS